MFKNERLREIMNIPDDAILISDPDSMQIQGKDIYEDADAFLQKLNLSLQKPKQWNINSL